MFYNECSFCRYIYAYSDRGVPLNKYVKRDLLNRIDGIENITYAAMLLGKEWTDYLKRTRAKPYNFDGRRALASYLGRELPPLPQPMVWDDDDDQAPH